MYVLFGRVLSGKEPLFAAFTGGSSESHRPPPTINIVVFVQDKRQIRHRGVSCKKVLEYKKDCQRLKSIMVVETQKGVERDSSFNSLGNGNPVFVNFANLGVKIDV